MPECDFSSIRGRYVLVGHFAAKHTPESQRPYGCNLCHRKFGYTESIESHASIHHGWASGQEKVWACNRLFREKVKRRLDNSLRQREYHRCAAQGLCSLYYQEERKDVLDRFSQLWAFSLVSNAGQSADRGVAHRGQLLACDMARDWKSPEANGKDRVGMLFQAAKHSNTTAFRALLRALWVLNCPEDRLMNVLYAAAWGAEEHAQ